MGARSRRFESSRPDHYLNYFVNLTPLIKQPEVKKPVANLPKPLIILAIVGLGLLVRLINGPRPNDDAFITFRYVENITSGLGFVYNQGEKVLGTTTPLYTLLLSLLYFPFKTNLPWLGLLLNTLADCGTILWLGWLGKKFCPPNLRGFEYVAPLLFALSVFSSNWCIAGMETSLFSFLLISTFGLGIMGRTHLAAVAATLAVFCRPEGILMVGLALAAFWLMSRRFPWREALIIAGIGLPWLIFATLYYGNPLPQSLLAKGEGVYIFEETGLSRLKPFSLIAWDNPFGQFITNLQLPDGKRILLVGLIATLTFGGLIGLGAWRIWRVNKIAAVWAAGFPLLFNLAYILAQFRKVLIFDWYLVPLVPWYLLLIGLGLAQLVEILPGPKKLWANGILTLFVGISLVNQLQAYDFGRSRMQSPEHYREAANFLAPRLKPGQTIVAPEIGMLGYFAPTARIFDSVGLVSPEALKYYPVPKNELASNNAVPSRMVLEQKPEYVISLELFVRNSLKLSPEFQANYTLLQKIPTNTYGSDGLLIFIRKDLS